MGKHKKKGEGTNMRKARNFVKKQKGITLIALVITVIVLIILAGVSINMIVGDNGIITQTQKAAEDTKQAQEKEMISLAMLEKEMGNTELEVGTPLYSKTVANGTKWHILTDKDSGTIYGDAISFDGVNDYIEIYADTPIDKVFTFEFYGKSTDQVGDIFMLSKSVIGDTVHYSDKLRLGIAEKNIFDAAFSNYPCESDWEFLEGSEHLIRKELNTSFQQEEGNYITVTVNLETNTLTLYINGSFLGETVCSHDWLVNGQLTDSTVPFTIGLRISGSEYYENYSTMELYACRLYDRVLTDEEIAENCETTIAYRQK